MSLFSYGSGCCAEMFAGTVVDEAASFVRELALGAPLEGRRRLTVDEYESIRASEVEADRRPAALDVAPRDRVAFVGTASEQRLYVG